MQQPTTHMTCSSSMPVDISTLIQFHYLFLSLDLSSTVGLIPSTSMNIRPFHLTEHHRPFSLRCSDCAALSSFHIILGLPWQPSSFICFPVACVMFAVSSHLRVSCFANQKDLLPAILSHISLSFIVSYFPIM